MESDKYKILLFLIKGSIASLVSANKIVFTVVSYSPTGESNWVSVFNSDFTITPNQQVEDLIKFLNTNKINGIVLDRLLPFVSHVILHNYVINKIRV